MSPYYEESVRVGREFQESNKSWAGYDVVKYQQCIKDLVDRYGAKTILDYGCGKGTQWAEPALFVHHNPDTPMMFKDFLDVDTVYQYDPCLENFATLPTKDTKFDIVVCTQVLTYIPDDDLTWVKQLLMSYTGKACFIGMHNVRPKGKKQIHDSKYFSADRTEEWYKEQFKDWTGSKLYWWFRGKPYTQDWIKNDIN